MLSSAEVEPREDFGSFLERDLNKELLRFTTAGSVDDGKSTLIGRLLHDSKALYEDQLAAVKSSRINRSGRAIDFSLLTDGLRAEREQGITIDVAYRYFSTTRRKFIVADTPGHEQYTRNMATGASTADLSVILVDATMGLLPQTRRHAHISALLGISNVVAAINKMDLVNYREEVLARVEREFRYLAESLGFTNVRCIPISALEGDNVVTRGKNMPWYAGPTLLEHLETVEIRPTRDFGAFRFPIQSVIRPDATFRGFAGCVASGTIQPGDSVLALPSRRQTKVKAIVTYDGELEVAVPQQSVVLQLKDEIDLSRGDLLVSPDCVPLTSAHFAAMLVWLDQQPLELNRTYLVKHCGRLARARMTRIRFGVDINTLTEHPAERLEMNDIASVEFETSNALFFDRYEQNRATGSFILIEPLSNATVGAGMIADELRSTDSAKGFVLAEAGHAGVSLEESRPRRGHDPAVYFVQDSPGAAQQLERSLFEEGFETFLIQRNRLSPSTLAAVLSVLWSAGTVVVYEGPVLADRERAIFETIAEERFFEVGKDESSDPDEIVRRALRFAETFRIGASVPMKRS